MHIFYFCPQPNLTDISNTHHTMAKSSRASAIKKNRTAIKKKVFGPVEDARAARLNAKLLELASQPKPAREDMEIEETGKSHTSRLQSRHLEEACTNRSVPTDAATSKAAQKESSSKNGGLIQSLTVPVPAELLDATQLLTPPSTPSTEVTPINLGPDTQPGLMDVGLSFFDILGASDDILGFTSAGDLELSISEGED